MKSIFSKSHYRLTSGVALWLSILHFSCEAAEAKTPPNATENTTNPLDAYALKHTINFNNVSVTEVVRFVSKITGYNFIFSPDDLNFKVTIVSEEPMSIKNITAALIQTLRVHELKLLEQDNSFVITKIGTDVNQIPSIVAQDLPGSESTKSPIITKIFRIKNAKLSTLVSIIKPMISASSIIEVIQETHQLIVTDITTNVDKISSLLSILDTPQSNLEIESYLLKNISADQIISLTEKILNPFLTGNPLLLIPQKETNTIFIISTPYLIEQTLSIMEDLDTPSKNTIAGEDSLSAYIYKIENQIPENLLSHLNIIETKIPSGSDSNLSKAIKSAKYISSAGTIVFITDPHTWDRLRALLTSIDTVPSATGKTSFWVYKTNGENPKKLLSALKQLSLSVADVSLQQTISTVNWIQETGSLVFTGSEQSIAKLQEIIPSLDLATPQIEPKIYIYKVLHTSEAQVSSILKQITPTLENTSFTEAVASMQWVKGSNSLIFKASPDTIKQLEQILPSIDVATPEIQLYIYKIQKAQKAQITLALKQVVNTTEDGSLAAALNSMQWIVDSNTLIFNTSKATIEKLQNLLSSLDVAEAPSLELYLYKVKNASSKYIISSLSQLATISHDDAFLTAVQTAQESADGRTLIFSTNAAVITKLETLLPSIDTAKASNLYMYKVKAALSDKINNTFSELLKTSQDKDLIDAIQNRQWLADSQTFIFNGTESSIATIKQILETIDIAATTQELYVYKIDKTSDEELVATLNKLAVTSEDKSLVEAIKGMQWIKANRTLIFNTTPETITKLKQLLPTLDIATSDMYFYSLQEASKEGLVTSLDQIAANSQNKELVNTIKGIQWMADNKTCIFYGSKKVLEEIQKILPSIDIPSSSYQLYVYKIDYTKKSDIESTLENTSRTLQNKDFTAAVKTMQWAPDKSALIFYTSPQTIVILKNLLSSLDITETSKKEIFLYKPKNTSKEQITATLQQMASQSQDKEFLSAIQTMQWIAENKTFIFTTTPAIITRLQSLLPSLDISHNKIYMYKASAGTEKKIRASLAQIAANSTNRELVETLNNLQWVEDSKAFVFQGSDQALEEVKQILLSIDTAAAQMYMYTVTSSSPEQLASSLKEIAKTSQNKDLVDVINTMQWTGQGKTFIFNGTPDAISELKNILPSLDSSSSQLQFYTYTVTQAPETQIADALNQASQSMQNKDFSAAIKTMRWLPDSNTLTFNSTPAVISILQILLPKFDVITSPQRQLYLYKIQQAPEMQIATALEQLASKSQDKELLFAIKSMQWIEKNNTLVFNTTPDTFTKLQGLLASLDSVTAPTQIYLYKVKEASQDRMEASLSQIKEGLNDPELITAINSRKWTEESQTYLFQGTALAISQLGQILPVIDSSAGPELQLYIYPIKTIPESQIRAELEKASVTANNKDFTSAIKNMQWIQESNSLVFNATPTVILKLQSLLPTFDNSANPVQMFIYKPKNAREEPISTSLKQMSQTVQDKDLANTMANAKWMDPSKTFVFHGTAQTIAKLEKLLPTLEVLQDPTLQLYTYQMSKASKEQMIASLKQTALTLQDKDFTSAIESVQSVEGSNALIFHTTPIVIEQLKSLLPTLDAGKPTLQVYMYKTENSNPSQLAASLQQLALSIQNKDLADAINNMKWVADTKTFLFNATPETITKLEQILPSLDTKSPTPATYQLYVYTVQYVPEKQIIANLEQMSTKTQDPDFMSAVQSAYWVEGSRSLIFNTTPAVIAQLQTLLPTLDLLAPEMYIYKVQIATPEQITSALQKMSLSLQDKDLTNAIKGMQWIDESHAFIFNGTSSAINQLKNILPSLDATSPTVLSANSAKGQFLIYNPQNQKGDALKSILIDLAQNLKGSGLQNNTFISTLDSMKWVPSSNSLVFTGDTTSLDKIREILTNIDIPSQEAVVSQTFVYKPVYATETQLQNALTQFAQKLDDNDTNDQKLAQAIYGMTWSKSNSSFIFKADPSTIARLKSTLLFLDSPAGLASIKNTNFFLYKLQYIPGDILIQNLSNLSKTLPTEDPQSAAITKAIQSLQWIKENNSLMITGSPYVIDQIKAFTADFDIPSAAVKPEASPKGDFLIYKPLYQTAEQIQQSLLTLAKELSSSSYADTDLLKSLQTARIVPSTKSLLFTGTSETLDKVKSLASSVDIKIPTESTTQNLGDITFLIYKIKQAPYEDLIRSLQTFASQLNQSNVADETLAKSLNSVNWIQETNSLMFTGPQETLKRIEGLVNKFDFGTVLPTPTPQATPSTFIVYTPKTQTGTDLINILHEFMQNLTQSGLSDPQLFSAISNLRFIDKTNSLVISGDASSIQKIQDLLVKFDVASPDNKSQVDASNFLIYKLQYHQGIDIQLALKKVATSLSKSSPDANQGLIDAIDSLQWIEVTNSLLGTGEPSILARIKHLVTNLDVPLRQVFIEVLVIETALFNSQNFGLQWGSQLQYLNKTIGAIGNFPAVLNNTVNNGSQFPGTLNLSNPISYTTNLNTPVQGNPLSSSTAVPFSTGFDLGVIGDIIFHKGQSFISLGSLLNALQVDNDSTVIMNPKIITQDGHTSSIFVGQNIPFVGSFVSNSASNTVQSSNIEYRDVGVNLIITPTLGTNNIVTLDISQDISEQSPNTTSVQGSQVTGIQTSHTTMNTRVHVPDRHFLVLSGMIQDTKTHYNTSIPCLGGLPVIGALFAENDRANTKSNVIIFLKPFIIDSFKDYDLLTSNEEELYKTQVGLQDLKEEFDAGAEMIKNLHNE